MSAQGKKSLSLRQNIIWNTLGSLVNQGCVWCITVVVVILSHGFDNSGILAFAMAIGNMFLPLGVYNMRTIQVSDVKDEISSRSYVGFRICTVVLAYVILSLYVLLTASSFSLVMATLFWFIYKADESFVIVYYGIYQKAMRMDYLGRSQIARGILTLGVFSLILFLNGNVYFAIIGVAIACMCVTIFYDRPKASKLADTNPEFSISLITHLLKKYFFSVIAIVFYSAVTAVSRQIFEFNFGEDALGIYAAIATPAAIVPLLAVFLYNPLIGDITQKWCDGDISNFFKTILKVIGLITVIIAVCLVLSSLFGHEVLVFVYGDKVQDYTYLLFYALIASAVTSVFSFLFDMLLVIRNLIGTFVSTTAALLMSVVLTFPLSDLYFMNGINLSITIAFAVGIVLECVFILLKAKKKAKAK